MGRHREYKLEEVDFKGMAYKSLKTRKVKLQSRKIDKITGKVTNRSGMVTLPAWLIGQDIDFIIIPKKEEQNEKREESNQSQTQTA